MKAFICGEELRYTGKELTSSWCLKKSGIYGNIAVGFIGAMDVPYSEMVDVEDVIKDAGGIYSDRAINILIELYNTNLHTAVAFQRLCMSIIKDCLIEVVKDEDVFITRSGDDIYVFKDGIKRKLSVSIATVSQVSSLLHIGINIVSSSQEKVHHVKIIGLKDLGDIDEKAFCTRVLYKIMEEWNKIEKATVKVLPK